MLIFLSDIFYRRAAQIVLGLLAVIVLLTFRDYGISWDEEIQSQYGQAILDYYASFFVDRRFKEIFNLYLYGGMFDGLAAFFNAYTPVNIYETRHLLNAAFGLLGLWGTWRLGRFMGGGRVGLAALVLLTLTPMYYGHMFNNPKDIPFAAGVVWTLYYMAKTFRAFPYVPPRLIVKMGIVLGLTMGIRVGAAMLLGYWGVVLMAHTRLRPLTGLLRLAIPVGMTAYAVMLVCWPWAQESPLANPLRALIEFSDFPQDVEVLLNGTIYRSTALPWFYLPLYLYVQLPVFHLALLALAFFSMPFIARALPSRAHRSALALILLTIFVPVCYAVFRHPALYDAVRHFIFLLPLFAVLGSLAFWHVYEWLDHGIAQFGNSYMRSFTAAVLFSGLAAIGYYHICTMIRLHPYEYIYVNALEGGVKSAFGQYELDYWGSSFKEAAHRLQEKVAQEGGVPPGKIYQIAICGPWAAAMIYLPPDFEAVQADDPAEFFLSTTRWHCENMRPGKEIVRIERDSAPLSIVKDLRTVR